MNGILDESSGDQPWDKVWTVDEMRAGASDWSLASDAGVSRKVWEECVLN